MLLDYLATQGITKVVLSVGYKYQTIQSYFGNRYGAMEISYSIESTPLGTGGAIKKALTLVDADQLFIINGDTFLQLNYAEMFASHEQRAAKLTLALRAVADTSRYGRVEIHNQDVVSFSEKQAGMAGFINSGIYLLSPDIFNGLSLPDVFSFETEFLLPYIKSTPPNAFVTDGYFIDIGVPEDFSRAQYELPPIIEALQS